MIGNSFILRGHKSSKIFALANVYPTPTTTVANLEHNVYEPAHTVDMVPALANQSLPSGGKFSEAGYVSICNGNEVNIFDGRTANITVSKAAVLKGCRFPQTKLWRIPLQANITNLITNTLLLNSLTGHESLNSAYVVTPTSKMRAHFTLFHKPACTSTSEAFHNVYELPSIDGTFRYLHAAAIFPTKATWLKSIRHGNYLTWNLITVNNFHKYFSVSGETQKGHMHNQCQGFHSTKQPIHTTVVPIDTTATSAHNTSASAANLPLPVGKPDLK